MFRNIIAATLEWLCWIIVALLCIGLSTLPVRAAEPGPTGAWVTASHDAVINIQPCGNALCGAISGIVLGPASTTPVDWHGQSQCGLVIVKTAAAPAQGGTPAWFGTITDPRNGAVYQARLALDANGNLLLRGYIALPLFGETQTWTRYTGTLPPNCRLSTTATQTAISTPPGSNG